MKRIYFVLLSVCLFCTACATSLEVNSQGDNPDVNTTDGKCETSYGKCSLRAAIMEANVSDNVSVITFADNVSVIQPQTPLPALTASNTQIIGTGVTIDASLFENSTGGVIEISGSSYNIIQGLTITGGERGIYINDFGGEARYNVIGLIPGDPVDNDLRNVIVGNGTAIHIYGADSFNNTIAGNFIGVEADGHTPNPNINVGVVITEGHDNLVGSTSGSGLANGGNVISSNTGAGVLVHNGAQNQISGNYIGTTKNGMNPRGNTEGVRINGGLNNIIGLSPSGVGSPNVISSSEYDGVILDGTFNNFVAGNNIGTNISGTGALPNRFGVLIAGGSNMNIIGTDGDGIADANMGNIISGNDADGVVIEGQDANFNVLAGNYIGTDASGAVPLPNGGSGVTISGDFSQIGTNGDNVSDAFEANVISGNATTGIFISSDGNQVAGNFIGTDPTGMLAVGNTYDGIIINLNGETNTIGTDGDGVADTSERNIISGNAVGDNGSAGIKIYGDNNIIAGNYIGTDATGAAPLPNMQYGITLTDGASGNLIGTNGDGISDNNEGNLISGNGWVGVGIFDSAFNQVSGNFIGTDASGTAAVPNVTLWNEQVGGVTIFDGSTNNIIGTDGDGQGDLAERNLISGNAHHGVAIKGDGTQENIVAGNFIGTDISGTSALPNVYGVYVSAPLGGNRIGTDGNGISDAAERNLISGNSSSGIFLSGEGNVINGNFIGTDVSGSAPLGNGRNGVYANEGSTHTGIGDIGDRRNVIAFNTQNGVYVNGDTTNQVKILYNSIFSNDMRGIFFEDGVAGEFFTPNDPADVDSGPNGLLNFPELTSAMALPAQITIDGLIVNGLANTNFLVQVFDNEVCDTPGDHGEGKTYLGSVNTLTNGSGNSSFQLVLPVPVAPGHFITSTATTNQTTSEFSSCVEVIGLTQYSDSTEEPRCDLFDPDQIRVVSFDADPDLLKFSLYAQMPWVPGLEPGHENPIPGDEEPWMYTAMLGNIQANDCTYQGYLGRLYCDFDIPEGYLGSAQHLQIFVNGCTPPIYINNSVSIFTPPEEAPVCSRDLTEDACTAAGGTYSCGLACACVCP